MVKPITPSEVVKSVPDEVIEAFNKLICEHWNGSYSQFTLKDAELLIKYKLSGTNISYESRYLDVEPIYRKAGWHVEYDRPGYNEEYDAFFKFSKKG